MKPLEPKFELYELNGKFLVRFYADGFNGVTIQQHMADTMENALRFIQSFYTKSREQKVVQFKKSDAEKPRHPYDRTDEYWENQEGMTTQTQYDFTLEDNNDKTDG